MVIIAASVVLVLGGIGAFVLYGPVGGSSGSAQDFVDCMAEHGVDLPDQGGAGQLLGGEVDVDTDDPVYQAALEECEDDEVPFRTRGDEE
jgi:hypothetical protein